jgi:RNA polymerase sigma-70 factor (ECF subfamily)
MRDVTQPLDFAAFFRATAPPLLAYLRRMGATPALADDLAQDAFEAFVAKGGLRWEPARARAYLYRVATNGYVDACRRRRREVDWDALPEPSAPESDSPADELTAGPAWRALSARQRQLLWLAYAEEFSHEEIAAICGLGAKSVRVLLFRAREAFKSEAESP